MELDASKHILKPTDLFEMLGLKLVKISSQTRWADTSGTVAKRVHLKTVENLKIPYDDAENALPSHIRSQGYFPSPEMDAKGSSLLQSLPQKNAKIRLSSNECTEKKIFHLINFQKD